MIVTGLWLVALFAGWAWWLPLTLFGHLVVLPPVSYLSGVDDALATLRDRYARGERTDEQFERKPDRLFDSETIEDVEDPRRRERERAADRGGNPERERERG